MNKKKTYKPPVKGRAKTRKDSGLLTMIRREKVCDLRMQKKSLMEIAKLLGVSHTTIKNDLDITRSQSKERNAAFWEEYVTDCTEELAHLIKTNWREWELSKVKILKDKEGNEIGREEKVGNPAFLQEIHRLVETKLKLAGSLKQEIVFNNNTQNNFTNFADLYQQAPIIDPAEEAIKLLENANPIVIVEQPTETTLDSILERLEKEKVTETINGAASS